ncbi:YciI family protein [Kineococcus sp. NUM-3379]
MAQYAVLIYADDSAHAPRAPAADTASCDAHAGELEQAGSMLVAYALTPRDTAVSLRAGSTTEGPFTGPGPVVAGFYVLEAPDLDAALAVAGTNPVLREGGGVEVRPVHSGGVVAPAGG